MIATEQHPDTLRLIDTLRAVPISGTITLSELTRAIGRDIRQCRHLLYSAIKHTEAQDGAVYLCVRGKGYRRVPAEEIVKVGQTARGRIRRTARRGLKTMAAGFAGANDMPNDVKLRILAEQSSLSLLEHISRERSLPKLPETETRPLTITDTARAFLETIGATGKQA